MLFKVYRKKPVEILAVQMDKAFSVDTLEGKKMTGNPGDFLVIGIEGESYPVKKDIFLKLYDAVEMTFEDMLKCHHPGCGVPFIKVSEHEWKGNCSHFPGNARLCVLGMKQ